MFWAMFKFELQFNYFLIYKNAFQSQNIYSFWIKQNIAMKPVEHVA